MRINCQRFSAGTDCSDAFGIRFFNPNKLSPVGKKDLDHFSGHLVSQLFEKIIDKVAGLWKYSAEPELNDDINRVPNTHDQINEQRCILLLFKQRALYVFSLAWPSLLGDTTSCVVEFVFPGW